MQAIIESSLEALRSGRLEPMFKAGRRRIQLREACTSGAHLRELRYLVLNLATDKTKVQIYTIDELQKSFTVIFSCRLGMYKTTDIYDMNEQVWFVRS